MAESNAMKEYKAARAAGGKWGTSVRIVTPKGLVWDGPHPPKLGYLEETDSACLSPREYVVELHEIDNKRYLISVFGGKMQKVFSGTVVQARREAKTMFDRFVLNMLEQ